MNIYITAKINEIPTKMGIVEMIVFSVSAIAKVSGTALDPMIGMATATKRMTPIITATMPSVNEVTLNFILLPPLDLFFLDLAILRPPLFLGIGEEPDHAVDDGHDGHQQNDTQDGCVL